MSIFNLSTLSDLYQSFPRIERFGWQGIYPFLLLDMNEPIPLHIISWLRSLPCPVIGIYKNSMYPNHENGTACDILLDEKENIDILIKNILASPLTSMTVVQLLRMSETMSSTDSLMAESFAYASLQRGKEFLQWKKQKPKISTQSVQNTNPLLLTRQKKCLELCLDHVEKDNVIDIKMRDALCEAFNLAQYDNSIETVHLSAKGRCFSLGGDVDEFGLSEDSSMAHWVRCLRLPARHLLNMNKKFSVRIEGASIGAGIEISAFADEVSATEKSWFQLPEVKYGLLPGAGGTVSIVKRIGRHKTAYMILSQKRISARKALEWGLIDSIG